MAVLNLLGTLVSSTDRYKSVAHRQFAVILTAVIKLVVGSVTPLAFLGSALLAYNFDKYKLLFAPTWTSSQWTLVAITLWCIAEVSFYIHCINLKSKFTKNRPYTKLSQSERLFYLRQIGRASCRERV